MSRDLFEHWFWLARRAPDVARRGNSLGKCFGGKSEASPSCSRRPSRNSSTTASPQHASTHASPQHATTHSPAAMSTASSPSRQSTSSSGSDSGNLRASKIHNTLAGAHEPPPAGLPVKPIHAKEKEPLEHKEYRYTPKTLWEIGATGRHKSPDRVGHEPFTQLKHYGQSSGSKSPR